MNIPRVCIPVHFLPLPSSNTISEDLGGLKVSHDFDGLAEGNARILTLKDSRILDNEGNIHTHSYFVFSCRHSEDELQNMEMAEVEHTKKNQELKIKRRDYTGYDNEEFIEGKHGMKRPVLAKYNELLEGPRNPKFVTPSLQFGTRESGFKNSVDNRTASLLWCQACNHICSDPSNPLACLVRLDIHVNTVPLHSMFKPTHPKMLVLMGLVIQVSCQCGPRPRNIAATPVHQTLTTQLVMVLLQDIKTTHKSGILMDLPLKSWMS